jgi:hypothetical protein
MFYNQIYGRDCRLKDMGLVPEQAEIFSFVTLEVGFGVHHPTLWAMKAFPPWVKRSEHECDRLLPVTVDVDYTSDYKYTPFPTRCDGVVFN